MSRGDCSFHVVDEAALARFVDRFLGRTSAKSAFDDVFPEADDMIAETRATLAGPDPAAAGRALGELALLYVSCEGPHAYSLGLSLSYWDEEDSAGAPMPSEALGTVEDLLGPIIDAYPAVRHKVPNFIFEADLLGPFVRARDVPVVLAYVEKVLDEMTPGDRRQNETLARVLRVAAARGMAYWEATTIEVPQAHEEWLDAGPTEGARATVPSPAQFLGGALCAREGDRYIVHATFETHFVDLSSFPPTDRALGGYQTIAAAFMPGGTALLKSATDSNLRPYVFALYEVDLATLTPRPLALDLPWELDFARSTGDAVLLVPRKLDARPLMLRDGRLTPLDLPPMKGKKSEHDIAEAAPFGDGSTLIIWDCEPYRLDGDQIVPLGGADISIDQGVNCTATLPDGSIALLDRSAPVRITRDGARETILPLDNAQELVSGPDDALIIREGLNVEGDALKIWWPATREVTPVHPDVFAIDDVPMFVIYAAAPRLLVVYDRKAWTAVPWSTIAALPRQPEAQFLATHAKLVAKDAKKKPRR